MGEQVIYKPFDSEIPIVEPDIIAGDTVAIDNFESAENLDDLYSAICDCQKCALGQTRTRFVFGVGNPEADIMFVGEAPGAEEDRLGEPFVGRAGKLLDKILAAMKLSRDDVFIANILKCRPPNNRDPKPEEAQVCELYLHKQIQLIKPKIVCCLGRISAQRLLQTDMSLGKMRDKWFDYHGTLLTATYHPAALLRNPHFKRPTWEDMQKILKKLEELK
ncbi:MAG: uracil-DNA glycosylase [candidate division Zixibacteria bacterium]|nr:uracil-DNA glycosylase [candidate division Zixibacteria bacterium]